MMMMTMFLLQVLLFDMVARPDNLKEMCLAKFAVNYDVISTTVDDDVGNHENYYEDDGDIKLTDETSESNKITLKNNLGYIREKEKKNQYCEQEDITHTDNQKSTTIQN